MKRGRLNSTGLARLRSEIARDIQALRDLANFIVQASPALAEHTPERRDLSSVALDLHRWYTALESLVERVERFFGLLPPGGDRWHQDLLEGAFLDIADVRPAVLPNSQKADLMDLLRFRHFLRHAYASVLDPGRMADLVAAFERVLAPVLAHLEGFERVVATLRDALDANET